MSGVLPAIVISVLTGILVSLLVFATRNMSRLTVLVIGVTAALFGSVAYPFLLRSVLGYLEPIHTLPSSATAATLLLVSVFGPRQRLPNNICQSCGYDLRGTLWAGRTECPECGAKLPPDNRASALASDQEPAAK